MWKKRAGNGKKWENEKKKKIKNGEKTLAQWAR